MLLIAVLLNFTNNYPLWTPNPELGRGLTPSDFACKQGTEGSDLQGLNFPTAEAFNKGDSASELIVDPDDVYVCTRVPFFGYGTWTSIFYGVSAADAYFVGGAVLISLAKYSFRRYFLTHPVQTAGTGETTLYGAGSAAAPRS
jgi:hypothetical protein